MVPTTSSDIRAVTSLNLTDNAIGGYYTNKGRYNEKLHSTPEGTALLLHSSAPSFNAVFV
jgi:hypothetical protein